MVYTDLTRKAMQIAYRAHDGQTDKAGMPYIMHPVHVAEQMNDEDSCVVALLHDVVEDTAITIDNLREAGFTEKQLSAIKAMTHDKSEPYMVYVEKLSKNPLAVKVKMADLRHNMDRSRIIHFTVKDGERMMKYYKALRFLNEISNRNRRTA